MTEMTYRAAANVSATLHVMGVRLGNRLRDDKGQTSAEYLGILVFVAAVVVLIIANKTTVSGKINDAIGAAIDSIK